MLKHSRWKSAEGILTKDKKQPSGQFVKGGGWGDDVILIVRGPNAGYSGFGFVGNHYTGRIISSNFAPTPQKEYIQVAMIWPNQEPIKQTLANGEEIIQDFSCSDIYHEEPAENCQVFKVSRDWGNSQ